MIYSREVEEMCPVAQGVHHGAAPIPEEAKWVQAKEVKDISGLTHGVGWCAPQQGACKLTLNVKERYHPGSSCRDYRMLRYDILQLWLPDHSGPYCNEAFEHRPCL